MKSIEVVAAIIINSKNEVLIARRSTKKKHPGKWEFPGGKIEMNESPENALKRELFEEFSIITKVGKHAISISHDYNKQTINLHAYYTQYLSGEFKLIDHDAIQWVKPNEIKDFDFLEADLPISNKIISNENKSWRNNQGNN